MKNEKSSFLNVKMFWSDTFKTLLSCLYSFSSWVLSKSSVSGNLTSSICIGKYFSPVQEELLAVKNMDLKDLPCILQVQAAFLFLQIAGKATAGRVSLHRPILPPKPTGPKQALLHFAGACNSWCLQIRGCCLQMAGGKQS